MAERRRFRENDSGDLTELDPTTAPAPATATRAARQAAQPRRAKVSASDVEMMELGCEVLLGFLPSDTAELVRECLVTNPDYGSLWRIIAGYILRCREHGELFSPIVLPEWLDLLDPNESRPCEGCGQLLQPVHFGQRWCCSTCSFGKLQTMPHQADCALVAVA